jgi:hypothetical protein
MGSISLHVPLHSDPSPFDVLLDMTNIISMFSIARKRIWSIFIFCKKT